MRPSNKTTILEAAATVVEEHGVTSVTFESVASAAGITRGGITYHFPSRDALVRALHEHMAHRWEQQLELVCGKPAHEASESERLAAYVRACATAASRGELQMLLDSPHTEYEEVWTATMERWVPASAEATGTGPVTLTMIALLAGDGLWVNEAITRSELSHERRLEVADAIIRLVEGSTPSA
ncbi:TetR/AcrR family transcriptional regulator [Demequina sp. NBRC 110057]|uniref:TetR/AcrR family transcriptional regulator n=1 Tax=Demequina sp. NBRC 110057 TaxID=1570346 RepID=UPI000A012824|nr:TetR/AcrR family transcriptional regulator [Demequina sp. NBRC 110057]